MERFPGSYRRPNARNPKTESLRSPSLTPPEAFVTDAKTYINRSPSPAARGSQTRRSRRIARPSHHAASPIAAVAPRFVHKSVHNIPRRRRPNPTISTPRVVIAPIIVGLHCGTTEFGLQAPLEPGDSGRFPVIGVNSSGCSRSRSSSQSRHGGRSARWQRRWRCNAGSWTTPPTSCVCDRHRRLSKDRMG